MFRRNVLIKSQRESVAEMSFVDLAGDFKMGEKIIAKSSKENKRKIWTQIPLHRPQSDNMKSFISS